MTAESPTLPSNAASPLADVLRLHRRVCLLRASGDDTGADGLERTALAEAWEALRACGDPTDLAPLLAAEEARVADAVLLAEMLAPLLAAKLAAREMSPAPEAARRAKPARSDVPKPFAPAPEAAPTVADFIEGMLAQDRAGARAK